MLCCNLLERYHCLGISFSDSSRRYYWWSVLTTFRYQNILSYFANASYMYREWIWWSLNVEISSLFSYYSSYLHYHIFIKVLFEQRIWIALSLLSFFIFQFISFILILLYFGLNWDEWFAEWCWKVFEEVEENCCLHHHRCNWSLMVCCSLIFRMFIFGWNFFVRISGRVMEVHSGFQSFDISNTVMLVVFLFFVFWHFQRLHVFLVFSDLCLC